MLESPSKHPLEVSKAVEFEKIKKLPKFSHANMACINPIHREVPTPSPVRESRMRMTGSPVKYEKRELLQKILPEHLVRPPPELFLEKAAKERTIDDIIRMKETKEGRKLTAKERKVIIDKEKRKDDYKAKQEEVRAHSKIFFKACQMKLEEINIKKEEKNKQEGNKIKQSIIGLLFRDELKGIRKLYNEIMASKTEKITRAKFLEFSKKILKDSKLTDTEIKELFTHY